MAFLNLLELILSKVKKWSFKILISNQFYYPNMVWNCIWDMLQGHFMQYIQPMLVCLKFGKEVQFFNNYSMFSWTIKYHIKTADILLIFCHMKSVEAAIKHIFNTEIIHTKKHIFCIFPKPVQNFKRTELGHGLFHQHSSIRHHFLSNVNPISS